MTGPAHERSDATLAARALSGEDRAFTALMGRHKQALYRFIRAHVGDADEALDLTQETFLAAWTALRRFDQRRPFDIWLRRIALNKCRDWARRRAVRKFFFGARSLDQAQMDIRAPPPDSAERETMIAALEAAIAALPPSLKEPLVLTALDGRSHQETADLLGLTPKAVEMRLYRARALLSSAVAATEDNGEG